MSFSLWDPFICSVSELSVHFVLLPFKIFGLNLGSTYLYNLRFWSFSFRFLLAVLRGHDRVPEIKLGCLHARLGPFPLYYLSGPPALVLAVASALGCLALTLSSTHQASPPDITALGEGGGLDHLRSHPGIGACGTHLCGLVPLTGQAEVSDLQGLVLHVVTLNGLKQQNWGKRREKGVWVL